MSDQQSPAKNASAPYNLAASFTDERRAGRAYNRAAELLIASERSDLSAYRLYVGPVWYVAIVGEQASAAVEQQLRRVFMHGQLCPLPPEFVETLMQRRAQATKLGPWVEAHYEHGGREP